MSKFPMIEDVLGLKVWEDAAWADSVGRGFNFDAVKAADLEAILEKGVKVNGIFKDGRCDAFDNNDDLTGASHSALLINIQPIKPPKVTREEVERAIKMRMGTSERRASMPLDDLLTRILKHGLEE